MKAISLQELDETIDRHASTSNYNTDSSSSFYFYISFFNKLFVHMLSFPSYSKCITFRLARLAFYWLPDVLIAASTSSSVKEWT
jgi:hypothetical protein